MAIRQWMEKSRYLKKWIPRIQETKLAYYRSRFITFKHQVTHPEKELKNTYNTVELFRACYEQNKDKFARLEEMLADDFSRRTLETVIRFRLSPSPRKLMPVVVWAQYFTRDILRPVENEVFVDGGGYVGDTILDMCRFWGKNSWKKIYTWEPDAINREKLIDNCRTHAFQNIEVIPYGLWSEEKELRFKMNGRVWARISENGNQTIMTDTIDHLCSEEKVTLIKMDIEGSEMEALRGAVKVIQRDKPRLAISIYHKPEDYYRIPFYIKEIVPEYKLYIRHHQLNKDDTVLYAVCP